MRIAHVVPAGELPQSGVLAAVVNVAEALAERGHHVSVWQLHHWDHVMYAEALERLHAAGVACRRVGVPRAWWGQPASLPADAPAVDIAHLHSVFTPPNLTVARALCMPYAVSPHGGYDPVSLRRNRFHKLVYAAVFERPLLRGAALRCALTPKEADDIRRFGGAEPIVVVPNGVHVPDSLADGATFRERAGIPPSRRLAVFVGRLDVLHKGLDLLLNGVAGTASWHVVLVGRDHRGGLRHLQDLAEKLGIGQRVSFTGPLEGEALLAGLAAADLFVLTSRWEGMPLALLEALACGVPALVTPPVEEAVPVTAAGAGWLATGGSIDQQLNRIAALGPDEWLRKRAGARRLAARYSWKTAAAGLEAAYQRVLSVVGEPDAGCAHERDGRAT
jgi:glycosyltransferase involved in cell wall biosynthesis